MNNPRRHPRPRLQIDCATRTGPTGFAALSYRVVTIRVPRFRSQIRGLTPAKDVVFSALPLLYRPPRQTSVCQFQKSHASAMRAGQYVRCQQLVNTVVCVFSRKIKTDAGWLCTYRSECVTSRPKPCAHVSFGKCEREARCHSRVSVSSRFSSTREITVQAAKSTGLTPRGSAGGFDGSLAASSHGLASAAENLARC